MNRIIKWYEYMIIWSLPILLAVSSIFYKNILNKIHIDNMFLVTYGVDLFLISAMMITYLVPFIEKLIIRSRFKQFELFSYKYIRSSELILVVIWFAASITIFLIVMLRYSIRPYYLFAGVFWNSRNLIFNQLYYHEDKIIVKNRIYNIDREAELLDDPSDNVLVKSKDNIIEIDCSNQLVKETVIALLTGGRKKLDWKGLVPLADAILGRIRIFRKSQKSEL